MQIFLIRHGRQSDTRCNVDVGLSPAGERQADLVGARIAPWVIDELYASDMIRARETAEIINSHVNRARIHVVPALRELHFGDMEGLLDEEIQERFGDFARAQARMDRDLAYPGARENVAAVLERTLGALDEIAETGAQRIAMVTHGVVIRALAVHAMGGQVPRWRETAARLENGSITELERDDRTGGYSLQRLNDHAHLEPHPELLRSAWGVREN